MRFQKIGLTTVVLCTVGIQQSFSIDIVTKEKPNIVFILADDLGWTDLGVMGSDYYETPNIDRLATEGILFDNAYAAAANSAPSRACMMTGMYTPRHGVYTVSPPDRGDRTKRKYSQCRRCLCRLCDYGRGFARTGLSVWSYREVAFGG